MTRPIPKPGVLDAPLYVPGEHKLDGIAEPAILSANENPLGPSEQAVAAYREAAGHLHRYPDGGSNALRRAIADTHGLEPERLICGAGSDELITFLIRAYAGAGDEVVYSKHGFAMYRISAIAAGATPVAVPESDLRTDVDAILETVSPQTKLVFIANPNNPTGSYISEADVAKLVEGLPPHVVVVLDSAYAEYVSRNDYTDGASLAARYENVVMLRTFSKIHGLAAVRLGWAYAQQHIIDTLNRLRGPFNVTAAAQAAGVAAMRDERHVARSRDHNDQWLAWFAEALKELGLTVEPSVGNFVIVKFADAETAKRANGFLERNGVIARDVSGYHLPEYLRFTIGLESECRKAVDAVRRFLESEKR